MCLLICECISNTFITVYCIAQKLLILMTKAHKLHSSLLSRFDQLWDTQTLNLTTRTSTKPPAVHKSQDSVVHRLQLFWGGHCPLMVQRSQKRWIKKDQHKAVVPLQFLSVVNGPSHQSRSYFFCYGKIWNGKRYPFSNVKIFWHLLYFFLQFG